MSEVEIKVAVFGSCRVVSPVVSLVRDGVKIVNHDNLWYTHSAPETLQKIEFLKGERRLDLEMERYVVDTDSHPANLARAANDYFDETEIAIVELSSSRIMRTPEMLLHPTCVNKLVQKGEAVEHELHAQSEEELHDALASLAALFPAVLFVTPILFAADLKSQVQGRVRLRDSVVEFCKSDRSGNAHYFDPMSSIQAIGPARALSDHNHYAEMGFHGVRSALRQALIKLQAAR